MHKITTKDFPHLDFGDVRRNQRFVTIVDNLSTHPGSSIPKQNGSWKSGDVTLGSLQQAIQGYGSNQIGDISRVLISHDYE